MHITWYKHKPFKQSREVVLVDALLSYHSKVGGQQGQSDSQQVWFTAQPVAEHPTGYQAHEVDLRDQSEVRKVPGSLLKKRFERKGKNKVCFHLVGVYQQVLLIAVHHSSQIRLKFRLLFSPGQSERIIGLKQRHKRLHVHANVDHAVCTKGDSFYFAQQF